MNDAKAGIVTASPFRIRRSTVARVLEHDCVFYCDTRGCEVHTFICYVDPDEPAYCPVCDFRGMEVVE